LASPAELSDILKKLGVKLAAETIQVCLNNANILTARSRETIAKCLGMIKNVTDENRQVSGSLLEQQARSTLIGQVQCSLSVLRRDEVGATLHLIAHAKSGFFWGGIETSRDAPVFAETLLQQVVPELAEQGIDISAIVLPSALTFDGTEDYPIIFDGLEQLCDILKESKAGLSIVHDWPLVPNARAEAGFKALMVAMTMRGQKSLHFGDVTEARDYLKVCLQRWNTGLQKADFE
jgi:hypothetical protein